MKDLKVRQSRFEIGITLLLLVLALSPALFSGSGSIFAFGHLFFLGTLAALLLEACRRLHRLAGTLLFAVFTALLGTEVVTYRLTGLHLNGFTFGLLFEEDALNNIGVTVLLPLVLAGVIVVSFLLAFGRPNPAQRFRLRWLTLLCAAFLAFTQLAYAVLYYQAVPGALETRRKLPFFSAPHRYYIVRALDPILGPRSSNPFANPVPSPTAGTSTPPALEIPEKRNVLLVVMDSVRAKDMVADPGLAPNLASLAEKGRLTLKHYAASNCTHFSMFSMFTGKLPSGFGAARQRGESIGFVRTLQANGYETTSAEALSLDWYNLSNMLFSGVTRYVAEAKSFVEKDRFVTDTTIRLLNASHDQPYFHLAYYNGAHFPYGNLDPVLGIVGGTVESYRGAIKAMDDEIGRLLKAVGPKAAHGELVIMITADHGESVFEDGVIGHSSALTDEQLIVPFASMGANDLPPPTSQLEVADYLFSQLGLSRTVETSPVILSNCSVEVPTGFAVIDEGTRADFLYEDGILSPVAPPDKIMPPKAIQLRAAHILTNRMATEN
ncbi:DUF3413 domain-containing protein [Kordiimonas aestuarii]|uniref:DUF3413 domain-containing protein n=1 Tax=Kordiimonas aestuarii TaxID=1005925 RepID=UPI0021CDFB9A|nr:DUF3413 domain-containing protein [Kordiimonas aestuarii]